MPAPKYVFKLALAAALLTEIAAIEQLVLNLLQRQAALGAVLGPRHIRAGLHIDDLAMIQPCLKVMGRGLDYHRWLEPLRLRTCDGFGTEVVNQAQNVEVRGRHADMRALGILAAEPLDCLLDLYPVGPRLRQTIGRAPPRACSVWPVSTLLELVAANTITSATSSG